MSLSNLFEASNRNSSAGIDGDAIEIMRVYWRRHRMLVEPADVRRRIRSGRCWRAGQDETEHKDNKPCMFAVLADVLVDKTALVTSFAAAPFGWQQ